MRPLLFLRPVNRALGTRRRVVPARVGFKRRLPRAAAISILMTIGRKLPTPSYAPGS